QPGDPPNQSYNMKRFTGQMQEDETSLLYLRARYYDTTLRRFISKDPYKGKISDPLSLSPYLYCRNNPVVKVDPFGNEESLWEWFKKFLKDPSSTLTPTPKKTPMSQEEQAESIKRYQTLDPGSNELPNIKDPDSKKVITNLNDPNSYLDAAGTALFVVGSLLGVSEFTSAEKFMRYNKKVCKK
ncbi:MAG: RHS repeat-associated core domain-containing protein, partial [Firmicutes bacterium]|nr:RHS repeat-associated core domain-containing protein [Bacillota bacterium]